MKELKLIIRKINEVEGSNKGKVVAIELESGDYFIGNSAIEAYRLAINKHPGKKFFFKRIGFEHTHFAGALA